MTDHPVPDPKAEAKLTEALVDDALARDWMTTAEKSGLATLAPSRLFEVVQGGRPLNADEQALLSKNAHLRALHCRMIHSSSLYALGEARAASSGDITRSAQGCKIRLESSQAEGDQVYVIIEFDAEDGNGARTLVLIDAEENVQQFDLPGVRRGVSQLIAEEGDALLTLLRNPKTTVYLR